ncbi:unnamed protein product, partial [Prorocentrum cordatum]
PSTHGCHFFSGLATAAWKDRNVWRSTGWRPPGDVLGVERGATTAEVTKAFKRLALQLHPDKRRAGAATQGAENEREQFQMLSEAYQVLKEDLDTELFARWSGKFCRRVDEDNIEAFLASYYGSADELEDMRRIVVEGKGLLKLFECLIGSKAADCDRYLRRIKQELKVAVSEKEEADFRKKAAAWQKKEKREAKELGTSLEGRGGKNETASASGRAARSGGGLEDLAAQIQARQAARAHARPPAALAAALRAAAAPGARRPLRRPAGAPRP